MIKSLGVVVGRFQVAELHAGHKSLIQQALDNFDDVIIFIGIPKDYKVSIKNPLPPIAIVQSIRETFPQIKEDHILFIKDIGDWTLWVPKLDGMIAYWCESNKLILPDLKISICGSRDSAPEQYKAYKGVHDIYLIKEVGNNISGTNSREEIKNNYKPNWTKENRELIVWLVENYLN